MKRILFFCFSLFLIQTAFAQSYRKTNFTAKKKCTIPLDNGKKFYGAAVVHLDQHPLPAAMYGGKKQIVQERRKLPGSLKKSYKTLGEAPNPLVLDGWIANYSGGVPMDNDVAVSNNGTVISAVNANLQIYDTLGNLQLQVGINNMDSITRQFIRISDPRLLYDPKLDRFILVCFSGSISYESNIIIGFSATNNPADDWNFYTLTGNPFNDSTWSDYPIISISDKDVFMTWNQIKDNVGWENGFIQSVIYQIKKDDGFSGNTLNYTLWDSLNYNGTPYRNICPAKYQQTDMPDDMYFLSVRNVDLKNDSVFVLHIDDSYESNKAKLTQRVLKSPVTYGFPPNPPMSNGNVLMTNDGRVLAAIYENDHIHFGANSVNEAYNNAGVLLGEIKNVSSNNPTIEAEVISTDKIEYGYPSMTYMGTQPFDHRVMYTFGHCYTDSFPGISTLYKNAEGQYSEVTVVNEGNSAINRLSGLNERWGDYSGIQKMYNQPGTAYLVGSVTRSNLYRAYVAKVQTTEDAPEPLPVIQGDKVYPNPVVSVFTTVFNLSKKENLSFQLYNSMGQRVATLLEQACNEGRNEFSFDKGVLAPGKYIFVIAGENDKILTRQIAVE